MSTLMTMVQWASGPGDQVDGIGVPAGVPDLVMLSAVLGTVMPPLVAIVQQPRWSPVLRALVVVAFSLAVGAGTAAVEGRLTGQRWTTSALIVGGAAVSAYRLFWRAAAVRIEYATSGEAVPPDGATRR
jgi:hypothetical protein